MAGAEIGPNDIIIHLVNPYKCLDCGTEFFHKSSFLQHLEDHMKKQKSQHPCHQIVCGVGLAAQQPNSITVTKDILQINENQMFELQDKSVDYTKLPPLKVLEQAGILHLPTPEKVVPTALSKLQNSIGINIAPQYLMQQGIAVMQKQANSTDADVLGNSTSTELGSHFEFNNLQNLSSSATTSEELQSLVQEALMENSVIKEELNMEVNSSCSPVVQVNIKNSGHCPSANKDNITEPSLRIKPIKIDKEMPGIISQISDKYVECKICLNKFPDKDILIRHQIVHTGEKPHTCFRCFKQFHDISSLTKHVKVHKRCHQCPVCLKMFLRRKQMELHLVQHKKKRFIQFGLKYHEVQITTSRSPEKQIIHEYSLLVLLKDANSQEETIKEMPIDPEKKVASENNGHAPPTTSSQENLSQTEILQEGSNQSENVDHHKIIYRCGHCKKLINTRPTLTRHLMFHTNEKPFKCDLCGKRFRHKSDLFHHNKTHSKPVKCNTCGSAFSKDLYLQNHLKRGCPFLESDNEKLQVLPDLSYKCNLCSKILKTKTNVVRHLRVHAFNDQESDSKKISKNIKKSGCPESKDNQNEKVSDNANAKDFIRALEHSAGFECLLCKERFRYKSFILIHVRMHLGQRTFKCKTCGKGFYGMHMLRKHQQNHTKPFKCPKCGKGFNRRYLMAHHFNKTHNEEAEDKMKDITLLVEDQLLECDICGKTMKSYQKSLMQYHIRLHKDVRPHQCKVCQKSFSSDIALKKHSLNHSKPYLCQVCKKGYSRRYLMLDHFEKVCKFNLDSGEELLPQKGQKEGVTNLSEDATQNQITVSQNGQQEGTESSPEPFQAEIVTEFDDTKGTEVFKCVPCDKTFTLHDALSKHLKTFKKTTKCKYCQEVFEDKHLTLAHQRSCLGVDVSVTFKTHDKAIQDIGEKQERVLKTMKEIKSKIDSLCPNKVKRGRSQEEMPARDSLELESSVNTTSVNALRQNEANEALLKKDIIFPCPKCGKNFSSHRGLKIHAASHVRLYKCEICGLDFTQVGKFRGHLKSHSAENIDSENTIDDENEMEPSQQHIGNGNRIKKSRVQNIKSSNSNNVDNSWNETVDGKENNDEKNNLNSVKQFDDLEGGRSTKCDKVNLLLMQSGTRGRPFSCNLCRKRFTEESSLQHHKSLTHGVKI